MAHRVEAVFVYSQEKESNTWPTLPDEKAKNENAYTSCLATSLSQKRSMVFSVVVFLLARGGG